MSTSLNWDTITPATSPRFMVKGAELNYAMLGQDMRFCVYEVRCYDADRNADRRYVLRDADTVHDADIQAGRRPAIVLETDSLEEALAYVQERTPEEEIA